MRTWPLGYEKSKQKAKALYSKIGRVQSPALNDEQVSFTNEGFNHLLRKGRIPRPKNEQKRRFVLTPYIEKIIRNPKANIRYERRNTRIIINRHGEKILVQSIADFWVFTEKIDDCIIKVVIRQLNPNGFKHFMSVMGNNVQIDKKARNKFESKKPRK